MFLRSEEWLKGKIDEFFADTSRSPTELIAALILNYEKELEEINKNIETVVSDLKRKHFASFREYKTIDFKKETAIYSDYLKELFKKQKIEILEYSDSHYRNIIQKALHKKPPFAEKDRGFKDAVIWESVKQAFLDNKDHSIAFISSNTTQFCDGKNSLKKELKEELTEQELHSVLMFDSVEGFLERFAYPLISIVFDESTDRVILRELEGRIKNFDEIELRDIFRSGLSDLPQKIEISQIEINHKYVYFATSTAYFLEAVGKLRAKVFFMSPDDLTIRQEEVFTTFRTRFALDKKEKNVNIEMLTVDNISDRVG
jgi:hypothetical protein